VAEGPGIPAEQPVFYFDLGSPECYLATERVIAGGVIPEFEPVLAADLGLETGVPDRPAIEAAALDLGIQPIRWPARLPGDARTAMLAATYAKQIGRVVAFSLAAFRQEFAAGRELDEDTIVLAGAACEMHPAALLKGVSLRSTAQGLAAAAERARRDGVTELPAIVGAAESIA
jgi:2-hydroxychromene-2-carboxylate isomerase